MARKPDDKVSDEEAERRATEALRRALTTPYRPQKEIAGASSKARSRKPARKKPDAPKR